MVVIAGWLFGCHSSVAEHWLHKPGVLGSIPSNCWSFHYFTSKHLNLISQWYALQASGHNLEFPLIINILQLFKRYYYYYILSSSKDVLSRCFVELKPRKEVTDWAGTHNKDSAINCFLQWYFEVLHRHHALLDVSLVPRLSYAFPHCKQWTLDILARFHMHFAALAAKKLLKGKHYILNVPALGFVCRVVWGSTNTGWHINVHYVRSFFCTYI